MGYLQNVIKQYIFAPAGLFFILFTTAIAQNNTLFDYMPPDQRKLSTSQSLKGKVTYPIRVNRSMTSRTAGEIIDIPLPSGEVLKLKIKNKWTAKNGDIQFTGEFNGTGSAIITFGKDSTFANFSSTELSFDIGMDEDLQPFLIDQKLSTNNVYLGEDIRIPPDNFVDKNNAISSRTTADKATASNKSVITLLAIYSPQFAAGFVNPQTRINQMIAFTNQAYERSGIHIQLELAHAQQISFNNSANIGNLLDQATDGTNAFSGLHALRNKHFADMVAILPFTSSGSVSGVAWVNGDRQEFAYSVSRFAVWGSDSVFAHELGHNLGSGHERISANPSQSSPCSGGYTGFACGHGNGSAGTIMSYLNDTAWNSVFSNPQLNCAGEPCGIAKGKSNSADNKTSFNITGPIVESFRIDTTNDDDKDGVKNNVDNCPKQFNPKQRDTDSDTIGDLCDNDDDGDGVRDGIDNCPLVKNPMQEDNDKNGLGDACQRDELCFPIKNGKGTTLICF